MKYLLVIIILLPSTLRADTAPTIGCFVNNGESVCSPEVIQCGNFYTNKEKFGYAVGTLCNDFQVAKASIDIYAESLAKAKALNAKYRRICGKKCKRVNSIVD